MIGRGDVIVDGAPIGRTGSTEPVKVSSFTVASAGDPPSPALAPRDPACLQLAMVPCGGVGGEGQSPKTDRSMRSCARLSRITSIA